MSYPKRARRFPLLAVLFFGALSFATVCHAEDNPAPPPPPPAPTQPATPPPAPAEAPKRKEDEAPVPTPAANLGTRVSAALSAMRGQGAAVTQLAERDATIQRLTLELTTARQQLGTANTELTRHRNELQQIEQAMRGLESERTDVTTTIAQLGFPAAQLPAAAPLEKIEDASPAGCYSKWEELKKTDAKAARAFALKNQATLRQYAATQPQWAD